MSPLHQGQNNLGVLNTSDDLVICRACGTQYEATELERCRVCDDPRQYVPPSGQAFTTFRELRSAGHKLVFEDDPVDSNITSITIQPNVGIGQRAFLIKTPRGNVLWDLICYLDEEAVSHINSIGGLSAIVISHPHFYTTWADWSTTFNVPVFLAAADEEWLNRRPEKANLRLLTKTHNEIIPGVTAIVAGGHFPGSMALHTDRPNTKVPSLFHADTIYTVPNARSPDADAKNGTGATSYSFMWSIPNNIPLSPDEILKIWKALKGFDIEATHGFVSVRSQTDDQSSIPERILESAKIVVKRMGYKDHQILSEHV